jgi:hypothetical protein
MKKWVLALVIGVVFLSLGATIGRSGSSLIYCGSDVMSPGDVCEETRAGSVETRTYEEMKESAEAGKRFAESGGRVSLLAAGGLFTVLGIAGIVVVRRGRKNAGPTTAPYRQQGVNPPQPVPPGYPPLPQAVQPGYPPRAPHGQQVQYPPQSFGPTGSQN